MATEMEMMSRTSSQGEMENQDENSLSIPVPNSLRHRLNETTTTEGIDTYTRLITEASKIPGGDESIVVHNIEDIPWIDHILIREGIHFLNDYFTLVVLADTFALMFGFCVKPMSAVVMRTNKLMDPEQSFQRYLSTVTSIARFYILPVNESMADKAFHRVRGIHSIVSRKPSVNPHVSDEPWKKELAEAVRQDLAHIDTSHAPKQLLTWDPEVPLSQFDMAVTQFGFIGVMWLFPDTFGIKNREKEMKGVIHLWAIIGRQLGLRDEYNVCLHHNPENPELFEQLYQNILVESLKTMDETVVTIQSKFMQAFTARLPFMTYKAMLYYGLKEVQDYKGEELWKLMSFRDKVSLKLMQAWFWGMRKSRIYRISANVQTGIWLQWQLWRNGLPTILDMGFRNLFRVFWM